MWNKAFIFISYLLITAPLMGQQNRYVVYFSDKVNSTYSVESPEDYLSERAIQRRLTEGISITESDFPVNSWYLDSLRNAGAEVFFTSRWFNAALIQATEAISDSVRLISIVDSVVYAAPGTKLNHGRIGSDSTISEAQRTTQLQRDNIHLINRMHSDGYKGSGVWIAYMDAGYTGVSTAAPFQHIYDDNKLVMARNLINNDDNVYQYSAHGTYVLSVVSGLIPGEFEGVAINTKVGLFITEDEFSEYRIEEYNWLFAAEMADSAGFDIINTSLGYSYFDDPTMDYSFDDLDGQTSVISKAANIVADKGILVVTSTGNEGRSATDRWGTNITFPADAPGSLAIGAVTSTGEKAAFSSVGPTADGRIKPDLAAFGTSVAVINSSGNVFSLSGTSFSAPIVSGMAAGIWQRFPDLTLIELKNLLFSWCNNPNPDNLIGYGVLIYDYPLVLNISEGESSLIPFPNPFSTQLFVNRSLEGIEVVLTDLTGRRYHPFSSGNTIYTSDLPSGAYILQLVEDGSVITFKLVKE